MGNLKFVVFNTNRTYGNMNAAKAFYPEGMSALERNAIARANKLKIAEEVGFDLNRLFMTLQPKGAKDRGSVYVLTPEDLANYKDLYDYDVYADTPKVTPDTPRVAIGFNVSDAANIIAMNTKTMEATSTFCPGTHIDAKVPEGIAEVTGGNPEDIIVDVSPFAHILPLYNPNDKNWMPGYINDSKVWDGTLYRDEKTGILYIDQLKALRKQLLASGIKEENIIWGEDSYYTTDKNGKYIYPSSQRIRLQPDMLCNGEFILDKETGTYANDPSQDGRFMHGVALLEETKEPYANQDIKVYSYGSARRR